MVVEGIRSTGAVVALLFVASFVLAAARGVPTGNDVTRFGSEVAAPVTVVGAHDHAIKPHAFPQFAAKKTSKLDFGLVTKTAVAVKTLVLVVLFVAASNFASWTALAFALFAVVASKFALLRGHAPPVVVQALRREPARRLGPTQPKIYIQPDIYFRDDEPRVKWSGRNDDRDHVQN